MSNNFVKEYFEVRINEKMQEVFEKEQELLKLKECLKSIEEDVEDICDYELENLLIHNQPIKKGV